MAFDALLYLYSKDVALNALADLSQFQQIIGGLSEGVILIKPDQTIAYANEAALAMHGVAWLGDLGATVSEYRENFRLEYRDQRDVGPLQHPIERAQAGEPLRDVVVEVRHARRPDQIWTHRIRSLVTADPEGGPTGLVLMIQDVSDHVEAEARFEGMFRANPAPALVCRIADLRYVKVNQGFLDLTGYAPQDVLGHSFSEIDVLHRAEGRALALEQLHAGETIPQTEACLCLPSDSERYVIVAGHPIEMPGGDRCMLFTFADLEDRHKAEQALRLSEERFAKAFQLSPVPTALLSSDGLVPTSINAAFAATFGSPDDGVEDGVEDGDPRPPIWVDPSEQRTFKRAFTRDGGVRGFEARLRTRDGTEVECLIAAERVVINGETCVLCAVQDITDRRRSERELIAAIEAVMADASWFSHGVIEKLALLRSPSKPGALPALVEKLTNRERDMLTSICKGTHDTQIAIELGLSLNTVRNHVASLYRKLGVNRRSDAIVWGRERGIGENAASVKSSHRSSRKLAQKH